MDGMHLATSDHDVTLTTAGTGGNPMATWPHSWRSRACSMPGSAPGRGERSTGRILTPSRRLAHWKAHDFMTAAMGQRLVVGWCRVRRKSALPTPGSTRQLRAAGAS